MWLRAWPPRRTGRGRSRRAFLASAAGAVAALAAAGAGWEVWAEPDVPTGRLLWADRRTGGRVADGVGESLVFSGSDGRLRALDPGTGEVRWERPVESRKPADLYSGWPVRLDADDACVMTDTRITLLDARSGEVRWTREAPDGGISVRSYGPAVGSKQVFARYGKRVHAYDRASGDELWSTGDTNGDPAVEGGSVFVPGTGISALSAGSGAVIWERRDLGYVDLQPQTFGGTVEVITAAGAGSTVHALDAATGRVLWLDNGVGDPMVRPWGGSGAAVVVDRGRVLGFRADVGARRWQQVIPSRGGSAPAAVCCDGSTVFAATNDDRLFAIDLDSGSARWMYDLNDVERYRPAPVSVVARHGVAYLAGRTGLFALVSA